MRGLELREFLRASKRVKARRAEEDTEAAPPLFFVSVASKGLTFCVSCLESVFTGGCVSVASTGVTGEAKIEQFRLGSGVLAAEARLVLDAEGSESKEGKHEGGKSREGEGDAGRDEPNMKHFTMDGYQLSIVFLFTQ
jgi:hypothetical protein